jgi:hypothetical protein
VEPNDPVAHARGDGAGRLIAQLPRPELADVGALLNVLHASRMGLAKGKLN